MNGSNFFVTVSPETKEYFTIEKGDFLLIARKTI